MSAELGARLRARDVAAAPAALNLLENRSAARGPERDALLAELAPGRLGGEAPGHVVGVTGPPGAGKSMLLSALARVWRAGGRTVAVLAVDPSSKRSGGALLGDRVRIDADPEDRGAVHPLDGRGRAARRARARHTVGRPRPRGGVRRGRGRDGRGRAVRDGGGRDRRHGRRGRPAGLGRPAPVPQGRDHGGARRARRHEGRPRARGRARGARPARGAARARRPRARAGRLVAPPATGIEALTAALDAHRAGLDLAAARTGARRAGALADFVAEHGEGGLRALGGRRAASTFLAQQDPGLDAPALQRALESRAAKT